MDQIIIDYWMNRVLDGLVEVSGPELAADILCHPRAPEIPSWQALDYLVAEVGGDMPNETVSTKLARLKRLEKNCKAKLDKGHLEWLASAISELTDSLARELAEAE